MCKDNYLGTFYMKLLSTRDSDLIGRCGAQEFVLSQHPGTPGWMTVWLCALCWP